MLHIVFEQLASTSISSPARKYGFATDRAPTRSPIVNLWKAILIIPDWKLCNDFLPETEMESGRRKAAIAADRMRRGVIVTEQAMVTC